ncbi:MAG: antitoxin PaaA2 family protein [Alcaligenes sp.]
MCSPKIRAEALRDSHGTTAYNQWLTAEITDSLEDGRPSVPHDEVMARMGTRNLQRNARAARDFWSIAK